MFSVPPPTVVLTSEDAQIHNQRYTATCVVTFVAAVPLNLVTMEWMTGNGSIITEVNDRAQVSQIRQINGSSFARDVTVNPLRTVDSGTYVCEAAVMGEFITSLAASESADISVFGKQLLQYIYAVVESYIVSSSTT